MEKRYDLSVHNNTMYKVVFMLWNKKTYTLVGVRFSICMDCPMKLHQVSVWSSTRNDLCAMGPVFFHVSMQITCSRFFHIICNGIFLSCAFFFVSLYVSLPSYHPKTYFTDTYGTYQDPDNHFYVLQSIRKMCNWFLFNIFLNKSWCISPLFRYSIQRMQNCVWSVVLLAYFRIEMAKCESFDFHSC